MIPDQFRVLEEWRVLFNHHPRTSCSHSPRLFWVDCLCSSVIRQEVKEKAKTRSLRKNNPPKVFPAFVPGWLTFLSVAQRLSLSAEVQTQVSSLQNTRADCQEHTHHLLTDKLILGLMQYLVPGHWFRPEERAREFYGETLLVVLGFVLWHTE